MKEHYSQAAKPVKPTFQSVEGAERQAEATPGGPGFSDHSNKKHQWNQPPYSQDHLNKQFNDQHSQGQKSQPKQDKPTTLASW